jgi:hypothetical protein
MSKVELGRYLGYCSELLALTSKIAALYIQKFNDDITLHSVGEVEKLCSSVSGKIWQKLWIVGGGELSVPGLDGAEREHALPIEDDSSARSLQAAPSLSSVGGEVTTPQGRAERVGDLGNPPARVTA